MGAEQTDLPQSAKDSKHAWLRRNAGHDTSDNCFLAVDWGSRASRWAKWEHECKNSESTISIPAAVRAVRGGESAGPDISVSPVRDVNFVWRGVWRWVLDRTRPIGRNTQASLYDNCIKLFQPRNGNIHSS
jgi:hypothetical protein